MTKVDRYEAKINIDAIGPSHPFGVFVPLAKASLRDTHTPAIEPVREREASCPG